MWFVGGEAVLGGLLRSGFNVGLQAREFPLLSSRLHPSRMIIVAQAPTSSSAGNETSIFASRQRGLGFAGASCLTWIDGRHVLHGHGRMCVAVRAEKGHETNSSHHHEEQRVKHEVHGFKIRPGRPTHHGPYDNIMIQAFNWESHKGSKDGKKWWQVLETQVEELCSLGITDVWLPPVSQSVDRQGYLPGELYNLDASKYGTGVQLKELIDALHLHGMCVIADIVINHRSGVLQDNKGHWNVFKGGNRDRRLDWGPWAVVDDDVYDSGGKGHHDTGESYAAAPDLDHTNKQVQDELTDWMNWLKAEIGFDGWRFDFVKGYAPKYTKMYCLRTNPTIAVGELWTSMAYYEGQLALDQNGHRQQLCDWIDGTDGTSCAFDFTTKGILQRALQNELWRLKDANSQPPGLIGWWPERAVTFLDNHDTGSTQRHWAFPDKKLILGYAYILTHPGIPCIFYDHIYGFNLMNEIKKLVQLRKRHRINARSKVSIQKAESDIYVAKIDNRVILKLGKRFDMGSLLPGKDLWKITLTGPDYAIWETTAPLPPLPVPTKPAEEFYPAKIEPFHPKQHIHLTSKMSKETKQRILEEVPELVDPKYATMDKSNRREQDHVQKDKVLTSLPGVISIQGKSENELVVAVPTDNAKSGDGSDALTPIPELPTRTGKVQPESNTSVPVEKTHDYNRDRTHRQHYPMLPDVPELEGKGHTKPVVPTPTQKASPLKSTGSEQPPSEEWHSKNVHIRPEVHGQRTRPSRPTPHGPYNNILLQGFNWESPNKTIDGQSWWTFLKTKVKDFADLGITDIWLPPVSQSVDRNGYLPSELYNLDASYYGNGVQLKELIDELHIHGICVIADIVIHHSCGGLQDKRDRQNVLKGINQDRRLDWGPWAVADGDVHHAGVKGKHSTWEDYAAAPDLDHTNKQVQDALTDWMNWLKTEIGFDGWRFGFVKAYDPKYTNIWAPAAPLQLD